MASSRQVRQLPSGSRWTFDRVLASRRPAGLSTTQPRPAPPNRPRITGSCHAQRLQRFGANPATVHHLVPYVSHRGFAVPLPGPIVAVRGTGAQVNQLFATHLTRFSSK